MGVRAKRLSVRRQIQRYAGLLIRINTALNLNVLTLCRNGNPIDLAVTPADISWFLSPGIQKCYLFALVFSYILPFLVEFPKLGVGERGAFWHGF
jgi:hypothetical protein